MNWIRESITDERGLADVAYVSLFGVMVAVLGAILFMCLFSGIAYWRCTEALTINPQVLCRFDPQPLGIAVGAVCGGFATALGGLAAYMAATRRPRGTTTATATATTVSE